VAQSQGSNKGIGDILVYRHDVCIGKNSKQKTQENKYPQAEVKNPPSKQRSGEEGHKRKELIFNKFKVFG
jgi:hypothetical protein